jgi:hypothetical protein
MTKKAAAKAPCVAPQTVLDAVCPYSDDDGFFISPLEEDPTDEEVRRLWRSGSRDDSRL